MRQFKEIQQPVNQLDWDDRKAVLATVKVGDRLWLGRNDFPCSGGIKTVSRLTPTLILVGKGTDRWDRFNRETGYPLGPGHMTNYITAIATEDEVRAYEAEQEKKRQEAEQRTQEKNALEAKRRELSGLFSSDRVYVREEEFGDKGLWSLNVCNLTEEEVRHLATTLLFEVR